jgi:signal transduction histidine kinase
MKKQAILLCWLLLLASTLAISAAVFRLLLHEQDRIRQQERSSTLDRLRAMADNMQLAVASVEDELINGLKHIPQRDLENALLTWQRGNPLIRNVFVWDPNQGLVYPSVKNPSTREERRFIIRFEGLFSGRVPWADTPETMPGGVNRPVPEARPASSFFTDVQNLRSTSKEMVRQASLPATVDGSTMASNATRSGWIPWYSENQLHLLGWVQMGSQGSVYGLELEFMTLLSRLVSSFPTSAPDGIAYALVDGESRIIHQVGNVQIGKDAKADVAVPLTPHIPHWQVAAFHGEHAAGAGQDRAFLLLSGLMLAIFVAAIILGGSLLMWQAYSNMRDARMKTSFVSNVSHELKTPLTSIRMYADLLREGRVKDGEKREQYLNVIADESERLTRLVNNVLDFSRLEEGRKKYNLEDLNIAELLKNFAEAHRPRISESGLDLEVNIPATEVKARIDRDAIEQVMLNLVDNAAKYAAEGRELTISLKVEQERCLICVMDRGPGVPRAHRKRIFEKFHRVDDSLTARHPGSGLGLSIARNLMRGMGGDLFYEPRDGGGSCFVAMIPYGGTK